MRIRRIICIIMMVMLLVLFTSCARNTESSFLGIKGLSSLRTSHEIKTDNATSQANIEYEIEQSMRTKNPDYISHTN